MLCKPTQRTIRAGNLDIHVAEAGLRDAPLVLLLHGFPEFWLEWRDMFQPLVEAGFRVAAPDQRGYNLSAKPHGVAAYDLDALAGDMFRLADALEADRFSVVGHDWGAAVAWWMATPQADGGRTPELAPARLDRLVTISAPHPAIWQHGMTTDPVQRRKSQYVRQLQIPVLPEVLIRVGGYKGLEAGFRTAGRPEAFAPEIMDSYHAAWRQPGALTGMLNWYRALLRRPLPMPTQGAIETPTLVLWGDQDAFVTPQLADQSAALCREVRVTHFPSATHWLPHDEPEAVADKIIAFLKAG